MNELRVLTGLHRGVALPMDANQLQIGSGFDSDLLLADQGIAENHMVICCDKRLPENCWNLEIGHEDIWSSDHRRISSGYVLKKDIALNVGGVWLIVMDSADGWPSENTFRSQSSSIYKKHKSSSLPLKVKLVGIGMIALLGTVALSFGSEGQKHAEPVMLLNDMAYLSEPAIDLPSVEKSVREVGAKINLNEALYDIKSMLKERGLYDLSVKIVDDNLELSGNVEDEEMLVLNRMVEQYTSEKQGGILIQNFVSPIQRDLPFSVVKVISGPYGFIESDDGMKITVGDSYKGFKLVSIDRAALRFEGPTNLTLKW